MATFKVYDHYDDFPKADWRWKDFKPKELACRGDNKLAVDEDAMDKLQALRDLLGKPIILNSAYRSPAYNRRIGGASKSMHIEARAYDCAMGNHDPARFEAAARQVGFTGFGFYPNHNFIHIDTGRPREWGKRWFDPQEQVGEPISLLGFADLTVETLPLENLPIEDLKETDMYDEKPWYASKTIWGALVALLSQLSLFLGVEITAGDQAEILTAGLQIVGGLGALYAVYGRIVADSEIT